MPHLIHDVIDVASLARLHEELAGAAWVDGSTTACGIARKVKQNLQLDATQHGALLAQVQERLLASAEFRRLAMPLKLTGLQIARYGPGMQYGNHVDGAMIGNVRTDLSFTLWLSDPATYAGGELVIAGGAGEIRLKPPAGSLVLYSSGDVHRVERVANGQRDVAVGWVQSLVRDHRQREVIADLGWLLKDYLQRCGHDAHAELMLKCQQNLSRMWIEPQAP